MKIKALIAIGVMVMSTALTVSWAEAAEKFGFLDVRSVMLSSNAGKKAAEEYRMISEKRKATRNDLESEIQKLHDELEKERPTLKEDALKEKEMAYQKKVREYELFARDSDEELRDKDRELSSKLIPEIMKVAQSIGEKEKYTMIIDIATLPIAYRAEKDDLTARVIEELNKTYVPSK